MRCTVSISSAAQNAIAARKMAAKVECNATERHRQTEIRTVCDCFVALRITASLSLIEVLR